VIQLVVILIALAPLVPLAALGLWTRWLGKRAGAPRWAWGTAAGIVALGVIVSTAGCVLVATVMRAPGAAIDPSDKARVLAQGISEAMNCSALVVLLMIVVTGWLVVWTWRYRWSARAKATR